jgi:hypothetical protein
VKHSIASSKMLEPKQVEIEVAGLALGDQIEAEWLPLIGIVYDQRMTSSKWRSRGSIT